MGECTHLQEVFTDTGNQTDRRVSTYVDALSVGTSLSAFTGTAEVSPAASAKREPWSAFDQLRVICWVV
jgi:hypothetical protein